MVKTLSQEIAATELGKRLLQQEGAILDVTELICEIMKEDRVSRSDLAKRLGKTRGHISQLLDGTANMTVRTVADIFTVLGRTIHFYCKSDEEQEREDYSASISWKFASGTHGSLSCDIEPCPICEIGTRLCNTA